jgi:hypothetical protein
MSASGANQTLPDSKQQRFVLLQIVLLQIVLLQIIKMGLRTVPQSPARSCSGCAAGGGWHSRDA